MTQRNLGNVQLGKMCSDTCVAKGPKPMVKPFESLAVGYALQAGIDLRQGLTQCLVTKWL